MMKSTALQPKEAASPRVLERWPELPENVQADIVAKLGRMDAARAATANKHMDRLVQESWPWPNVFRGNARRWPLPTMPATTFDKMLAPYSQDGHLHDMLHCIRERYVERHVPLHEGSIFEADLECWVQREEQNGNALAAEAAGRIRDQGLRAPELILSHLPIRTLPRCIGELSIHELYLCRCDRLEQLPDAMGDLRNLQMLVLDGCTGLSRLPDAVVNLPNLKTLSLVGCPRLVNSRLSRPGLTVINDA